MCMGTTKADAGSAENFINVDYNYVIAFTELLLAFSSTFEPLSVSLKKTNSGDTPDRDDGFYYHFGDGTNPLKKRVPPPARERTGKRQPTLRALTQVSSDKADPSSYLLYMKTKGAVDSAVCERVLAANQLNGEAPVRLTFLRPGLLDRGDKSRGKEKLGRIFMSAMPVWKCGKTIVEDLVNPSASLAVPTTFGTISCIKAEKGEKDENVFQLTDKEIKKMAGEK
ncbi:hypothetical protein AGDE_15895 [Angomonas deanei]|nr:hypothetical protein AGDE_15895 [Angomonas deanei]|eukprot:EPY18196.1 hypothetical protein AGDE_15895 [Angomonas deanei]